MMCGSCAGRGTRKYPARGSTQAEPMWDVLECHECLGLGAYERGGNPKPQDNKHFVAIHSSNLELDDLIDLLPQEGSPYD